MTLIDLLTYFAVFMYVLLAWLGRSKRQKQASSEYADTKQDPSIEELQAWRQSLGIPEPEPMEEKPKPEPLLQVSSKPPTTHKHLHPKARTHQRRMSHNFRFQATLDKFKRATNIDTRDYKSRIEGRKAPGTELVSNQLKEDAPEDAYALDKTQEPSLGLIALKNLNSNKDLIILSELMAKPRCYLAPTHLPGHWWYNTSP